MPAVFRPKTILFATDFLESSRLALDFAVAFAHHYQAKLLIVHVFHLTPFAVEAEVMGNVPSISRKSLNNRMEALAAAAHLAGVEAEWRLIEGWMPDPVITAASEVNPGLLVLGTHGVYHGLGHMLIGSNAEKILNVSCCPTLTVGRHVPAGVSLDVTFERIVYITDFSPESAAACPYAVALQKEFGGRLDVFHLLPEQGDRSPEAQEQRAQQYCEAVRRTIPDGEVTWCEPGKQLEHAYNAEEILERMRWDTAGLIVLGIKGGSQFSRLLQASLAYQLVATAASPVLTIRG